MGNCLSWPINRTSAGRNNAKRHGGDGLREASPTPIDTGGMIVTPNLKEFTLAELRSATKNFRPKTMLGAGGMGTVCKGWVDEKTLAPTRQEPEIPIAVKIWNGNSNQGIKEWQAEVEFLGKFCHPNLVKLLGYCWEEESFILVYEYMQKGHLENHLFSRGAQPLSWETRIKIAIGAARGLAFLHNLENSVIYRDFKPSNILLDSDYNPKLSDFGSATLGPVHGRSHISTRVIGTAGYAAPEYIATGHLYVKSDVYGFGVVLLELLTGLRSLDTNRPSSEHNLVVWMKPYLGGKRKMKRIMDPKLGEKYSMKAATEIGKLIVECLDDDARNRPSMDEVLLCLENANLNQEVRDPK